MYIDFYRFVSVGAIMSSPAVEDGVVYVGSLDGNLYALR
jgi:outer membrane protein assembly factor BamB